MTHVLLIAMLLLTRILLLAFLLFAFRGDVLADLVPLSETEASQRIAAEATAKAHREAMLKAKLQSVPAEAEWELDNGGRKVVFRRVSPKAVDGLEPVSKSSSLKEPLAARSFSQAEMDAWIAAAPEFVMFSVSATVYDGEYSRLEIRHADEVFTAWTNVDFRYLSGFGGFETKKRSYRYANFTDLMDREQEAAAVRRAAALGHDYESRWKVSPVAFSGVAPEYVMVTADATPVPAEIYRRLDALFAHYVKSEAELHTRYHNTLLLNGAREEHRELHPQGQGDIILNYSRVSEAP